MTKKILVTGGAGYIGSHMVRMLTQSGFQPVVLDDLSTGHAEFTQNAPFIKARTGDVSALDDLFKAHKFAGVLHFAAFSLVAESMTNPAKYFENNVEQTRILLKTMVRHKVDNFVLSSTAAIFGNPEYLPIDEAHPKNPINPYGESKLQVEQMLGDFAAQHGLKYGCLRYFNAAGAEDGLWEWHDPETHLIPIIFQVLGGIRPKLQIYGNDYQTPDGTCIRDYIHVTDLCRAHLQLLEYLWNGGEIRHFNLGTGNGYSVKEVIDAVEVATGCKVPHEYAPRRTGDPAILVADNSLAQKILGAEFKYGLDDIVRSINPQKYLKP
jgi:UDP-glucose 4-epimerase